MPRIVLPLGYHIDADVIGTFSLVLGRTYDVTDYTIATILNRTGTIGSNHDGEALWTANTIRKFAAFKPNDGSLPHGMSISSYEITYVKPTENFNSDHWAGYNINCPTPFVKSIWTIYFKSTGVKKGYLWFQLPEIDVRDINVNIEQIRVSVYDGIGYSNLYDTLYEEVNDLLITNGGLLGFEYEVNCSNLADKNYKIVIDMGYIHPVSGFVKVCEYPSISGGAYELELTAYYDPDPVLLFQYSIPWDEVIPTPTEPHIIELYTQNESIVVSLAVSFEFDFKIIDFENNQDGNRTQVGGTCDIYMKNPTTEVWHLVAEDVAFANSGWTTVSDTLDTGDFPSLEVNDNVEVEFRNVNITS